MPTREKGSRARGPGPNTGGTGVNDSCVRRDPSARQAGGLNVDSQVTFTPLSSTYRTVTDTSGCPAGCIGKFTFRARLTNQTTSPAMPGLSVHVQTLSNGNVLLDPQTNPPLGARGRLRLTGTS